MAAWVSKMDFVAGFGFPVARRATYGQGYQYRPFADATAFILDAFQEDPALFVNAGRFATCFHLFATADQLCRFLLDVDIKNKEPTETHERVLEDVCKGIVNSFNHLFAPHSITTDKLWVCDSNAPGIGSYHVILTGFSFHGMDGQKRLFRHIKDHLPRYASFLDDTQSARHLMRAVNCTKPGETRYLTLRHQGRPEKRGMYGERCLDYPAARDPFEQRLLMVEAELAATSFVAARGDILITVAPSKKRSLTDSTVTQKEFAEDKRMAELARVFPQISQYTFNKAEGNRIYLRRKSTNVEAHCEQCQKTHSSDHAFLEVNGKGSINFNCWRAVKQKVDPLIIQ